MRSEARIEGFNPEIKVGVDLNTALKNRGVKKKELIENNFLQNLAGEGFLSEDAKWFVALKQLSSEINFGENSPPSDFELIYLEPQLAAREEKDERKRASMLASYFSLFNGEEESLIDRRNYLTRTIILPHIKN